MGSKTANTKQAADQNVTDQLQRQAQLEKLRAELVKVLFNRTGLARLRAISDEEWQRAQDADDRANS